MSMVQPTGQSHRKFKADKTKGKNIDAAQLPEKAPEHEFTVLLEKFLRYCSNNKGLKQRTVKTYRDNTKRLIKWLDEEKKVADPKQVTSYIRSPAKSR
jgi:hypothetical protein